MLMPRMNIFGQFPSKYLQFVTVVMVTIVTKSGKVFVQLNYLLTL